MKKKISLVCLLILFCLETYSQSPILFDYQWHLNELKVDGNTYFPSNSADFPNIVLSLGYPNYNLITNVCNSATGSVVYLGTDTNIFNVQNYVSTALQCSSPEITAFDILYLNNFWSNATYFFDFPNYPESIELEITSLSGNKASFYATTLKTLSTNKNPIKIYPNPSSGHITINISQIFDGARRKIFNLLGEIVFNSDLIVNNQTFDISNLATGAYLIEINSEGKFWKQKLIKI